MTESILRRLCLCLLLLSALTIHAQTLVNQSVQDTIASPSRVVEFARAIPLPGGEIVYVNNIYNSSPTPDNEPCM